MSRSFEDRHIGPTSNDEAAMLKHLGYSDLASFIKDVVPSNIAINGVIATRNFSRSLRGAFCLSNHGV